MQPLFYTALKDVSDALVSNKELEILLPPKVNGKYHFYFGYGDFNYNYHNLKVDDGFYYHLGNYNWKQAVVTYKRSGVLFYKDSDSKKEKAAFKEEAFFKYICPMYILVPDDRFSVTCICPLTELKDVLLEEKTSL